MIQDITFHTGVDTNEYATKDRTRRINQWYKKTILKIIKASKEWGWADTSLGTSADNSWTPASTKDGSIERDLAASTRGYQLPTTNPIWLIWRVALMLDGSNLRDATPFHIGARSGLMKDTDIDNDVSTDQPFYRIDGDKIFVFPLPTAAVTNGIKIWGIRQPTEFAASDTTKIAQIETAFQQILSLGPSYDYLSSKSKPNAEQKMRDIMKEEADMLAWISGKLDDSQPNANPDIPSYA